MNKSTYRGFIYRLITERTNVADRTKMSLITCHISKDRDPSELTTCFTFRSDLTLGERVSVQCTVNGGDTPLQVTWTKDGMAAESVGGVQVRNLDLYSAILTISHLAPLHAGNYTCTATNDAASVWVYFSHAFSRSLPGWCDACLLAPPLGCRRRVEPPVISPFSFGPTNEGERVRVVCAVKRGDPPVTLVWLKDGAPIAQDTAAGLTILALDQYSSSLLLPHVHAHHSGNYTCQATNAVRSVSHSDILDIQVPPSWIEAPRDTSVTLGGSVVVPCHAHGSPTPKVTWRRTREDQPGQYSPILGSGHGQGVGVAMNGSLVVVGARSEDEGQYLCEAVNGVGGGLSALISLTVNAPPRFDPGLQRQVSVRRGSRATLLCHAHGDPPITLLWQATHTRVHDHRGLKAFYPFLKVNPFPPVTSPSVVREVDGGARGELWAFPQPKWRTPGGG
ncbi:Down syndrome cell adhesion molecule-like protein Dscam2 [Penaeus chinensis]|uniref:Down syndrome cell adhesion molecule-like protein Dscam2 n=1 Tax=Penaeus chinensis TaxID=139456 RepID=UPI001FB6FCD3|nr:Down syndrome cell adhesion molecule-like protein Dscam2 [Penaeus chinensis]